MSEDILRNMETSSHAGTLEGRKLRVVVIEVMHTEGLTSMFYDLTSNMYFSQVYLVPRYVYSNLQINSLQLL